MKSMNMPWYSRRGVGLVVVMLVIPALLVAAPRKKRGSVRKRGTVRSRVTFEAAPVELFSAMKEGLVSAKVIPLSERGFHVLLENKSDQPLNVQVPSAVVAFSPPILKQMGGGGMGGGGMGGGGMGGGAGGGSLTVQQPVQAVLNVTTTVSVPDGGTVLLGGVKRLKEGRNMAGVPILNKIPYISRLFKNSGVGRDTESVMLMVTPRIIIQEEEEELLGIPPE